MRHVALAALLSASFPARVAAHNARVTRHREQLAAPKLTHAALSNMTDEQAQEFEKTRPLDALRFVRAHERRQERAERRMWRDWASRVGTPQEEKLVEPKDG